MRSKDVIKEQTGIEIDRQFRFQKILTEYHHCLHHMDMENWDYAPIAMRKTVEVMVQYILDEFDPSGDEIPVSLFEKMEFLSQHNLVSRETLSNYHKIRMFGNRCSHSGSGEMNGATCRIYLNILREEFDLFSEDYKNRDYRQEYNVAARADSESNETPIKTATDNDSDNADGILGCLLMMLVIGVVAWFFFR